MLQQFTFRNDGLCTHVFVFFDTSKLKQVSDNSMSGGNKRKEIL